MPEPLKDLTKSSEVLLPSEGEDDNTVQIEQARPPVKAGKDVVHEAGEGGGSVAKTKGDLVKLIQLAAASPKGGFCLVLLRDGHLPIPTLEVQGGEPLSPMECVEEVIYQKQRVSVVDGSCVELTEVNAKGQATVYFSNHYYRRSPRTVRGADDVAGQHLLNLCHFLPSNCGVLSSIRLAERGSTGLYCVLQQRSTPEVVFPLAETSLNSRNSSFNCCCWSGERPSSSDGRCGGSGRDEAGACEAEGGVSDGVTTSRTPIFCPEWSWRGSDR